MSNSTFLIRRNGYFSWRRRGAWGALQVALGTDDPALARRAAAAATHEAEEVLMMMEAGLIAIDEARARIAEALRLEIARSTLTSALARSRKRTEDLLRAAVGSYVTQPTPSPAAVPAARHDEGTFAIDTDTVTPAVAGRDGSIIAAADRLCRTLARTERANDKTRRQISKTAALFAESTGITDVTKIRQGHIADFVDLLDRLPPTYRKSPAERDMTLQEIAEAAEARGEETGLSVATINRTLTQLHQIIDSADAEGLNVDAKLKVSRLKRKAGGSDRDKRLAFTTEDIRAIFGCPVWQGSKSLARRLQPGPEIIRDALYWIPLIAAYTGARREEIAGMMREEIKLAGGHWCFLIAENDERGVKSASATRIIPVHPHLIELGLLEHAKEGRMFPDLKRKSSKSSLGDALDYRWRGVQAATVKDGAKKSFHSFRHHFVDQIELYGKDLSERTKNELSGHAQQGTRNRVYGSAGDLQEKVEFINRLPRVF